MRLFVFWSLFLSHMISPFFPADTLIKTNQGFIPISQIVVHDLVACVDADGATVFKKVTHVYVKHIEEYYVIVLDGEEIKSSLDQQFYVPNDCLFKRADALQVGDLLLSASGELILVRDILCVEEEQEFFDITVAECHNFFVSHHELLVHNFIPVAVGFTWVFGGGLQFVGASLMTTVLGSVAALQWDRTRKKGMRFACEGIDAHRHHGYQYNDAQAPGKPTEKDGYVPPKDWDGKKVKHPRGYGWPDNKGRIWIPTGNGGSAHGGPHWDVQYPGRGKNYDNVFPGGKVKPGK